MKTVGIEISDELYDRAVECAKYWQLPLTDYVATAVLNETQNDECAAALELTPEGLHALTGTLSTEIPY